MKLLGVFVILIISCHTIRAHSRHDDTGDRYFECADGMDNDYGKKQNKHRLKGGAMDGEAYFHELLDCNGKQRPNDHITVREPLHSFLTSLLPTPLKSTVLETDGIITDVERKSNENLSKIDSADISTIFNHLVTATDKAFDLIWRKIFDFINAEVPDMSATSENFFTHLNNLKWSIHDLNDFIARYSHSSSNDSSIRSIEDAALIVGFSLIDLLSSAMKLIENVSTTANARILVGRVLVEFFGVLQLAFDAVASSDVAINVSFGGNSRITSSLKALILDVFSSLLKGVSDLPHTFSGDFSDTSSYYSQFNAKFSENTSLYTSKYHDLLNAEENIFEIVKSSVCIFDIQLKLLDSQLSGITTDNASSIFKIIPTYVNSIFRTIDFMIFTLSSRMPQNLLSETNNVIKVIHDFQSQFKQLLKAVDPPINESAFGNITEIAVQLMYMSEKYMTEVYKFIIAATGNMSEVVSEFIATAMLVSAIIEEFYYHLNNRINDLTKLFTGRTVPFFSALFIIEGLASLYSAVGKVIVLLPALYTAKADTLPSDMQQISIATDSAFKQIINVYTSQVSVIPNENVQTVNKVAGFLRQINADSVKLLSSVTSLTRTPTDNASSEAIGTNARALAADVQEFIAAISKLIQDIVNNVENASQTTLTGLLRELLISVLQIVYYVVFSITRYLNSVIPETATLSVLSNIENAFVTALSQSTVLLKDFDKFVDNDVQGFKEIISFVTVSIDKTVASLAQSLNGIVVPVASPTPSLPTDLIHKLEIVISNIHVNINNGDAKDISEGLRNLLTSTNSSFESITNAVQEIIAMFPNESEAYANVMRSSLPNVQIKTHSFIQDVQKLIGKSSDVNIRDVRASAIRAVSAVSDFGKAISEIVNTAANELTNENILLLVTLQKILAINSQTTSYVVTSISDLLDVIAATNNNPLGDLSNILNNMAASADSFIDGFTLSSDSNLSNVYNQIKASLGNSVAQMSNGIATVTVTVN